MLWLGRRTPSQPGAPVHRRRAPRSHRAQASTAKPTSPYRRRCALRLRDASPPRAARAARRSPILCSTCPCVPVRPSAPCVGRWRHRPSMTLRSPPHITHVHIRLCTETSLSIHTHAPAGRLVCNDLNSAANVDDDHCAYPGCTSSERIDYDPIATIDDGLCVPPVPGCTCSLSANFDRQARRRASIAACMDPRAYSYDERAQVHIQDECLYFEIGCTDKDAINFQSWATSSGPHALCVSCLWLHLPSSSQLQSQSQPPHDRSLLVAVHGVHRQAGEQLRQAGDDWRPEPVHVRHRGLCRPDRQQLRAARHRLDRVRLFDHRLHGYHRTQLYLRRHRARQVHVPSPRLHLC